jgi:hypothetical protein
MSQDEENKRHSNQFNVVHEFPCIFAVPFVLCPSLSMRPFAFLAGSKMVSATAAVAIFLTSATYTIATGMGFYF